MKNIKTSSFIFIILTIFLVIDCVGYKLLYHYLTSSHEKDTKILFYKIKSDNFLYNDNGLDKLDAIAMRIQVK